MPGRRHRSMAEELLPRLRVAEWLDRADAALADVDELDLRDLRSVVAAADDPVVARDEATRELAAELRAALAPKQDEEHDAVARRHRRRRSDVGRVVRALRLSSQPPKAGVPFPAELATRWPRRPRRRCTADAASDRWVAVLEARRSRPSARGRADRARPSSVSDELLATVKRVGPLLPQVAALFEHRGARRPQPCPSRCARRTRRPRPSRRRPRRRRGQGAAPPGPPPRSRPSDRRPPAEPTAAAEPKRRPRRQPAETCRRRRAPSPTAPPAETESAVADASAGRDRLEDRGGCAERTAARPTGRAAAARPDACAERATGADAEAAGHWRATRPPRRTTPARAPSAGADRGACRRPPAVTLI